jgi:hypothetical protein
MDTDDLIKHSRARFDHAASKKLLKEKYESKLIFGYRGGMFRSSPELMVFLDLYNEPVVLTDLYDTPIQVDPKELRDIAAERWQEQMNAWLVEYQELAKNR